MKSLSKESSTNLMMAIQPLVPFIAVGKHVVHPNGARELQIDSYFFDEKVDKNVDQRRYIGLAKYKLKDVTQKNYTHHNWETGTSRDTREYRTLSLLPTSFQRTLRLKL
jgi:hypothetical protein